MPVRTQHLLYFGTATVVLVFSLATSWQFAVQDALFPGGTAEPGDRPTAERWEFVLTATFGATLAWVVSLLVTWRLLRVRNWVEDTLLDARTALEQGSRGALPAANPEDTPEQGATERSSARDLLELGDPTAALARIVRQLGDDLTRAEAEARSKSTFLANMSHELRTPLNAIIGFSELIKRDGAGPISDRCREYVDNIHGAGEHLLELVNDILDLSKIESGAADICEEDIELAEVIRCAVVLLENRAQANGVTIKVDVPERLPLLRADRRKLKQILLNLLTNAVKFTPPGGQILVKAWCSHLSGCVLQVADTGIGIALGDIPKIFVPFQQIDDSLARKHGGAGLGLPITKAFVELHGGSLDLQSRIGKGTTVTVRFPQERVA